MMYFSSPLRSALFLTTIFLQQRSAVAQLIGAIQHYGSEGNGVLIATLENNSTANYSIAVRNSLFDDANPYRPFVVKNLAGRTVLLVGTLVQYGDLNDDAFISFGPGTIWQREFNMTEYIIPDATATAPYSECFSVSFPAGIFAVNTTDFVAGENLATGFLTPGIGVQLFVDATPLHLNITVGAGKLPATQATRQAVGTQEPATVVAGTGVGLGAPAATVGNDINAYLGGATGIFAKEQKRPLSGQAV